MKYIKIPMLLLLMAVMYSCKKDKKTDPTETDDVIGVMDDASKFSQLKVGNYWIYQEFDIDSLGTAAPTSIFDSCYVEKDTMLMGKTYFKMWKPYISGPPYRPHFIRDSADCIIESGLITFSCKNFLTPIRTDYSYYSPTDTIYKDITKMVSENITVPAGFFSTFNAKRTFYINPKYASTTIRYMSTRYAANVGIISETSPFYLSSNRYTELRLVRYHLN